MATQQDYNKAMELVKRAMDHQMAGELDDSIRLYKQSIALCPTADAYTYLGWAYSFQGRIDEAIAQCEIAIQIDPEFGNPYNDIGVYLMQRDRLDEAIPWFGKAKLAKRYEPRQFPYMNLGRIHLRKGQWWEALREFEGAVRAAPTDVEARKALHTLRGRLN